MVAQYEPAMPTETMGDLAVVVVAVAAVVDSPLLEKTGTLKNWKV